MAEEVKAPEEVPKHLNVRQAAFIGVGAMVGAGASAWTTAGNEPGPAAPDLSRSRISSWEQR